MTNTFKNLREISGEIVIGAKKRRQIANFLEKRGFLKLKKGAWLGFRGEDVVSGLLIEGSPTDTYISSFLLPVFDKNEFVSWTLGRRLIRCSANRSTESECEEAVSLYSKEIGQVETLMDFVEYLGNYEGGGFYPIWAMYISLIRARRMREAIDYLNPERADELLESITEKFVEINNTVIDGDVDLSNKILSQWEDRSRIIFGNGEYKLS